MEYNEYRILNEKICSIMRKVLNEEKTNEKSNKKNDDKDTSCVAKRQTVIKWLNSAQELHSVLAYRLWPSRNKDSARSLFYKKYRGGDSDGNEYSFTNIEINKLFNMKNRYIDKIS